MTRPSSQGPCICTTGAWAYNCPRHHPDFMGDIYRVMIKDHLAEAKRGDYRHPPVDPLTGRVSAGPDAILMHDMRHCDVPQPHRRDDCLAPMRLHGIVDFGYKQLTVCPEPLVREPKKLTTVTTQQYGVSWERWFGREWVIRIEAPLTRQAAERLYDRLVGVPSDDIRKVRMTHQIQVTTPWHEVPR